MKEKISSEPAGNVRKMLIILSFYKNICTMRHILAGLPELHFASGYRVVSFCM